MKMVVWWLMKRGLTIDGGGTPFSWILGTKGSGTCVEGGNAIDSRNGLGWALLEWKEGLFFRSGLLGRLREVGIWMMKSSRKVRCGIFGKSRTG